MFKKTLLLIFVIMIAVSAYVPRDSGYHMLYLESYITNIHSYKSYHVLVCVNALTENKIGCYKLRDNQKIDRGYIFNELALLGIKKEVFNHLGGTYAKDIYSIDNASEGFLKIILSTIGKVPYELNTSKMLEVKNSISINKIKFYYEIQDISSDYKIFLKLIKKIIIYKNGNQEKIIIK